MRNATAREALELKLREMLDDDDAVSAVQMMLAAGWRPPSEADALKAALTAMRELASVSYDGDPWYAEHEGLDAAAIFAQAAEALDESR